MKPSTYFGKGTEYASIDEKIWFALDESEVQLKNEVIL